MTLVILVRHALSQANETGILAGRSPGVHLSAAGRKQAAQLAKRLGEVPVKAVLSSPLERCEETIAPWLRRVKKSNPKITLTIDFDLSEVDYGKWTGRKLRSLSKDPLWKDVQITPSSVTFPEGESLISMQSRATEAVQRAVLKRGKGHVIVVSHGDVIKSVIASSLNMHLDEFQRIVIDPASITLLDYSDSKTRLILMNDSRSTLDPNLFMTQSKRLLIGGGAGTPTRGRRK